MTKKKQQNNPKFSFLYGGDHHSYYLWKVKAEREGGSRDQHVTPSATTAASKNQIKNDQNSIFLDFHPSSQNIESMLESLHQTKLKEQADIAVITDPLEREFQSVINPFMNSCTNESMAVSLWV